MSTFMTVVPSPDEVPGDRSDQDPSDQQQDARSTAVQALTDGLADLLRSVHAIRAAGAREPGADDRAALQLLFPLLHDGPQRAGALAEAVHADPSTVSRQTAELVRRGLVERLADPEDGRAWLLAVTAQGRAASTALAQKRHRTVRAGVAGWTDGEIRTFSSLLSRFAQDATRSPDRPGTPASALAADGPSEPEDDR